uniref:Uncharacterized protein n=1 Tax=Anguilla anguilla TaxID=7936 RepID=A0A0E9RWR0_ANGAN
MLMMALTQGVITRVPTYTIPFLPELMWSKLKIEASKLVNTNLYQPLVHQDTQELPTTREKYSKEKSASQSQGDTEDTPRSRGRRR